MADNNRVYEPHKIGQQRSGEWTYPDADGIKEILIVGIPKDKLPIGPEGLEFAEVGEPVARQRIDRRKIEKK
jgi:hypothetical protein